MARKKSGKKRKKDEEYWEEWGENFGKKMEEWGNEFGKNMEAKFSCESKGFGIGGMVIAILILAWGVTWLGNDLGWWQIAFPFWPIVIILIGLAILLSEIRKGLR